jgi:hypothetical protein
VTEKSKLENPDNVKSGDSRGASADIHADQNHPTKYETNPPLRHVKTKREIMEELSRERFPWEEE